MQLLMGKQFQLKTGRSQKEGLRRGKETYEENYKKVIVQI